MDVQKQEYRSDHVVTDTIVCLFGSGVQPLNDIEEVNMFKDDNTVVHFRRP